MRAVLCITTFLVTGTVHARCSINIYLMNISFFKFLLFIYLTQREIARAGTQAGGVGEEEAGFLLSREPDAGLDPRSLRS